MIDIRHVLPPDEYHKILISPYNPYGTQPSDPLNSWLNLFAYGWSAGVFYKTVKVAHALRLRGWTDDEIADMLKDTIEDVNYDCLPQFHMITGKQKPLPAGCQETG